jgi:lysophospholipase L1-like esterase
MPDTPDGDDDGPRRPSGFELAAGAVVVIVAVVVGAILLIESDVGGLIDGEDDDHIDIALVGDSFLDQSRPQFLELAERRDLTARIYAYGGTSICGWQDELNRLVEHEPDVLVLSFAGNDLQPCINSTGETRSPETVAADYARDIDGIVEQFRPTGTDLYVVDPPPIRDAEFEANAEAMREMYRDVSIDHPRITVIETEARLGPGGEFHAALPCARYDQDCRADGTVVLRQGDGIHLTPAGGRRYAQSILDQLDRDDAL